MKKFMNGVETILSESLDGLAAAHADLLQLGGGHKFVRRRQLKQGKVGLLSGGGAGHEPLHAGFVGLGIAAFLKQVADDSTHRRKIIHDQEAQVVSHKGPLRQFCDISKLGYEGRCSSGAGHPGTDASP